SLGEDCWDLRAFNSRNLIADAASSLGEDLRMNEQIARDAEVARIHADEEIQAMIDSLDKSNETVAKYLQEYQQFASDLSLEKKIELIREANVPTGSGFIPTAGPPATIVSNGIEIDAQVARELEEQQERDDMRMNEQIARDAEVARIHAEEEIQGMIDSLDKSNETIAKYLQEYQQFASDLSLEKKIELISDLVKYQEHYKKISKVCRLKRLKPSLLKFRNGLKTSLLWAQKEEVEKPRRKGKILEKEQGKKQKLSGEAPELKPPIEKLMEAKLRKLMKLFPVEVVYVQALQVNPPTIDWRVHSEGERNYWQIIRLGGSTACYQFFIDLLTSKTTTFSASDNSSCSCA
nr:hypothetical protein [Tanacetum cinerariifolium]